MTTAPLSRAAVGLGAAGIVSPVFALSTSSNNNFVLVQGVGLVVLVVLGLLAVAGGLLERPLLVRLAGGAYAVAAILQLVQFGRTTNWLGGNGSTFALMASLATGLLVVGLQPTTRARERVDPGPLESRDH